MTVRSDGVAGRPGDFRRGTGDRAMALGLALVFLAVYLLSPRPWLFGDGSFLLNRYADGEGFWMHLVYLPAARVVQPFLPDGAPFDVLRYTSAVGAAVGLAFSFLLARRAGVPAHFAAVAAGLVGLSPAVWFFAIQVEVHGTQFGALALGAWLAVAAPWRRFPLALLLSSTGLAIAYAGHQSAPALGPGWVALSAYAAARQGVRLSFPLLLFAVGPAQLMALLMADGGTQWLGQPAVLFGSKETALQFAAEHHNPPSLRWWQKDVLEPMGYALFGVLLGAIAWVRRRLDAREIIALALLVGVPGALFAAWAVDNRGGYLAAAAPFLVWWIGRGLSALPPVAAALLSIVLLGLQAQYGYRDVEAESRRFDRARHLARGHAAEAVLPSGGLLLSIDPEAQDVRQFAPRVKEVPWLGELIRHRSEGLDPEVGALQLLEQLERKSAGQDLGLDLSYRAYLGLASEERLLDLERRTQVLEAALFERFQASSAYGGPWPMVRLERR